MATIPPGGIVPVPDAGGGVGAAVTVAHIINAKWENAVTWLNNAIEAVEDAVDLADPAPSLVTPTLDTSYLPPTKPTLPIDNPEEGQEIYDQAYAQIGDLIERGFRDFLGENFPNGAWWTGALNWLDKAINQGGTGIDIDVERQIWERDKARLMTQGAQAEAEQFSTWANRGFPLPPGALVAGVQAIRLDMNRQLAGQSRDIAIKSFEAELENTRFAVEKAIDLRMRAVAAAGDYVKSLALGPQLAVQLATGLVGLKTDLARSLTQMYAAEVAALEPNVRLAITDASLKMEGSKANLESQLKSLTERVNATIAHAQMVGAMAAASFNGIGADARISGSDNSSV